MSTVGATFPGNAVNVTDRGDLSELIVRAYKMRRVDKFSVLAAVLAMPGVARVFSKSEWRDCQGYEMAFRDFCPNATLHRVDVEHGSNNRNTYYVTDAAAFQSALEAAFPEAVASQVLES